MVSKTSTKTREKMTKKPVLMAPAMSILKKMGLKPAGRPKIPWNSVTPMGIPMMVVIRIPIRMAPRTRRAMRMAVMARPMMASKGPFAVTSPRVTRVEG